MDSDSEIRAKIIALRKRAESVDLNLVVIGKAGQGKSTLLNRLLGFQDDEGGGARPGGKGQTETKKVSKHSKERNGAVVNIWDTPGLHDNTHVKQEEILAELSSGTKKKMDLAIVCVAFHPGIRIDDSHKSVITLLTKMFGEIFWTHALFAMTFVNTSHFKDGYKHKELLKNVEIELKQTLKEALGNIRGSIELADEVPFMTAGDERGSLPYEEEEWNGRFFKACLERIDPDNVPTILQVRYGAAIWEIVFRTAGWGAVGAGGGVLGGAAIGAAVGAGIGLIGGPPTVPVGAWVGALVGGAVGGVGGGSGAGVSTAVKGYENTKDIRAVKKLVDKAEQTGKTEKKK